MTVGILSDTHGLLRPEALAALRGVEHLIHAGDVGNPTILHDLRQLAPLTAIRGNIDRSPPCSDLPATEAIELAGHLLYIVHARNDLDINLVAAGVGVVIFGHSHKPLTEWHDGVLYLNPGSAGPRRFSLPISVALLHLEPGLIRAEIIPLDIPKP